MDIVQMHNDEMERRRSVQTQVCDLYGNNCCDKHWEQNAGGRERQERQRQHKEKMRLQEKQIEQLKQLLDHRADPYPAPPPSPEPRLPQPPKDWKPKERVRRTL